MDDIKEAIGILDDCIETLMLWSDVSSDADIENFDQMSEQLRESRTLLEKVIDHEDAR